MRDQLQVNPCEHESNVMAQYSQVRLWLFVVPYNFQYRSGLPFMFIYLMLSSFNILLLLLCMFLCFFFGIQHSPIKQQNLPRRQRDYGTTGKVICIVATYIAMNMYVCMYFISPLV